MEREIYTPQIENAPPTPELRTLYSKLGEEKIRILVDTFYNLILKPHPICEATPLIFAKLL